METYDFTTTSGTACTVSCSNADQAGQFAVAELSGVPEAIFLALGSAGIALAAAGGVLAWQQRPIRADVTGS